MCDKLPYENPRIDKCLIELIKQINSKGEYKTVASCCGHNIYPTTIVVRDKLGEIFEYFTKQQLRKPKKHRFYRKDSNNYYYLNPELFV